MAICAKCYVQSLVDGVLNMPADDEVGLVMAMTPLSDGEVEGDRSAEFAGRLVRGSREEGAFAAEGNLFGSFGPLADEPMESRAFLEVFAKDGEPAFIQLTVDRDSEDEGVSFAANLRPAARSAESGDGGQAIKGLAFLGWPNQTQA